MTAIKGRVTWIPPVIIDEVEDIRREDNINTQSEAMKHLVQYARVGRELQRIIKLDWSKAQKRQRIEDFFK